MKRGKVKEKRVERKKNSEKRKNSDSKILKYVLIGVVVIILLFLLTAMLLSNKNIKEKLGINLGELGSIIRPPPPNPNPNPYPTPTPPTGPPDYSGDPNIQNPPNCDMVNVCPDVSCYSGVCKGGTGTNNNGVCVYTALGGSNPPDSKTNVPPCPSPMVCNSHGACDFKYNCYNNDDCCDLVCQLEINRNPHICVGENVIKNKPKKCIYPASRSSYCQPDLSEIEKCNPSEYSLCQACNYFDTGGGIGGFESKDAKCFPDYKGTYTDSNTCKKDGKMGYCEKGTCKTYTTPTPTPSPTPTPTPIPTQTIVPRP